MKPESSDSQIAPYTVTRITAAGILLSACLSLFIVASCSRSDPKPANNVEEAKPDLTQGKRISSLDVVRSADPRIEINAGSSGEVGVHLMIQEGYHINANPPTYPYLRATKLTVGATPAGISTGPVVYPKALTRKFGFAEQPLDVYEGEVDLKLSLKVDKSAAKGETFIPVMIEVQACDDQVCYAPAIMNLMIRPTIK